MSAKGLKPAIFLDRDGVLNRVVFVDGLPYSPKSLDELVIPPDVPAALAQLKAAGFTLVVVTNQPEVSRGRQTRAMVDALNGELAKRLHLDEVRVCYHDNADNCVCRKPMPGLILQDPQYDLARSFLIGDRWRDIEAGKSAGVKATVLVQSDHVEPLRSEPDFKAATFSEAARWILSQL